MVALLQRDEVCRPVLDLPPTEPEAAAAEAQLEPAPRLDADHLAGLRVAQDAVLRADAHAAHSSRSVLPP
ncbi:hypothetical protein JCM10369A_10120 [Nocardioides pyridinolyticus]